eukprot:gnl/TRDRNA2_/TRDRNA2_175728_c1_seq1.p1 gnl/TRDRNA2_/TRDRNA2_175728_c1~~gnl/TRDRNA2_/TRDRNA2_175728_c1_seq1.p1  ORF type:complete len:268 (-),score=30.87 gnl/TRDRNA2_/TRDRNA2_175728_c1_seq1:87-890(-)
MAQAIFGLSHLRSSLPAAAFAHLVPPRIASSIIVPSYRPQLMMQPSTMVWMAAFLLFAAVDVNGEAHAECMKAEEEMTTNSPKTADGMSCFGSRRLDALLPDLQHSFPFQARRLQSSMAEMKHFCDANCKPWLEKYYKACAPMMEKEGKDPGEVQMIIDMCEPCTMAAVDLMTTCDSAFDEPDGMCKAGDSCKAMACTMVDECDGKTPQMFGGSGGGGMEHLRLERATNALKDCPCPESESATSGAHLRTASFGVMLLLALLVFLQQ